MPREIDLLREGLCKMNFANWMRPLLTSLSTKLENLFLGSSSCEGEAFVATVSSLLGLAAGTCHLQRWITAVWRSRITIETNVVTKSKRPTRSLNALKAAIRWCLKRAPQLKSPDQQSPKLQSENLTIFEEGPKFWRKKKRPSSAFYYKFSQCTSTHQISIWIRLA